MKTVGRGGYPGAARMLLIWTAIGTLTVARYQLPFAAPGGHRETISYLLACVSWYLPWSVLSPLVFRFERRFPIGRAGWLRHAAVLATISVPFCLGASPFMMLPFSAIRYAFGTTLPLSGDVRFWFGLFPSAEGIFWCSVAGGYFFRTVFELQEQQQRASRLAIEKSSLEASLNQAQLEAIRARLNPHFLFNSLQNISVLTGQDPQTASQMLTLLGDLLRAVLRRESQPECTLAEEIEITRTYVAIEQMRFADRLRVIFDIPRELRHAMIPCFLMQPLLENAILHGLRGVGKTGIIAVRASEGERQVVIDVTDNGIGAPSAAEEMKIGIGLGSTCERLALMYPERHDFSIQRLTEGGTRVRIALPLRFAKSTLTVPLDEETSLTHR